MTDNKNDNEHEHEHTEDFEEEFEFEGDLEEDALAPEEVHETEEEAPIAHQPERKGIMLPLIIGLAIAGFVGWKIYGMFGTSEPVANNEANEPIENQTGPTLPKIAEKTTKSIPQIPESKPAEKPNTKPATTAAAVTTPPSATTPSTTLPGATTPASTTPGANLPGETGHVNVQPSIPALEQKPSAVIGPEEKPKIAASDEALTKLQKKLDDQERQYKQQIQTLQKELDSANQNSVNANKAMGGLQHDISSLSAAVQALKSQMQTMQEEKIKQEAARIEQSTKRALRAKKEVSLDVSNPSLTVYAIIPGRAWLRSQNGKTTTVVEGDQIGEYGKVLKIDAGNGVVITSSGATLR